MFDFHETFSHVGLNMLYSGFLESSLLPKQWKLHQLDINNAFLNNTLRGEVYRAESPNFKDILYPHTNYKSY